MTLAAYKVLHILGILFLFIALGGLLFAASAGAQTAAGRKLAGMLHGLGLVIILVTGFGALARLGISSPGDWPLWVWLKAAIWLALGASLALIRRAPGLNRLLWFLLPVLGMVAAYLALYKPV